VSTRAAFSLGAALIGGAIGFAWLLAGVKFLTVVALYLALTCAYSLRLKHEPVVDMVCVSAGFVLRAIGGGVAVGVPLSNWFLLVASFGALFVVTGKRSAEHSALGDDRSAHRRTLAFYPASFLRAVRIMSGSVTTTAYCLWAFERSVHLSRGHHPIWFELSVIPVVIGLLHIELLFETGHGASPEDLALRDRLLQGVALSWLVCFAVGVYG
jgi:decaprenyl-phosphate phosphoribosyltransferase